MYLESNCSLSLRQSGNESVHIQLVVKNGGYFQSKFMTTYNNPCETGSLINNQAGILYQGLS